MIFSLQKHLCTAVLFGSALVATSAISEEVECPAPVTPRLVVVNYLSEAAGRVTFVRIEAGDGPIRRSVDGRIVTVAEEVTTQIAQNLSVENLDFYDVHGNSVTTKEFFRRTRIGDIVLLSGDNRLPDCRYLRLFRESILVAVSVGHKAAGPRLQPSR